VSVSFKWKGPLGVAVMMNGPDAPEDYRWDYFFTGLTIGNVGIGIVWRRHRRATATPGKERR